LEIVIVNDGSTDKSADVILEFQKKYPNRKYVVISQENSGLSNGRRRGVENSNGEYITFLDADDYVDPYAYEKMYNYLKNTGADIVEVESQWGDKIISSPYNNIIDAHEYLKALFWCNPFIWPMLWLRIYSYKIFEDKSPFVPIFCNNEDVFAFPCILYSASKIGFIKEVLHYYSIDNEESVVRGLPKDKSGKYYENRKTILRAPKFIEEYFGGGIDEFKNEYEQYVQNIMITFLHTPIYQVSYDMKYKDICEIMGFQSKKDTVDYVKKNAKNMSKYSLTVKILGIRLSGVVKNILR
jgi:glycosyltransferase involved in cell wall biosynthesis